MEIAQNSFLSSKTIQHNATVGGAAFCSLQSRVNGRKHYTSKVEEPSIATVTDALSMPACFAGLFEPHRYKIFYGGRGGAKSWSFADALLTIAVQRPVRVLCARELQVSIADSVHKLLSDRIASRKLDAFFTITRTEIRSVIGSEFLFKGLRFNAQEIKSLEGVDIVWVEEAQKVSKNSWDLLIPTIRKQDSEIWMSFNPGTPYDETWVRFVENTPDNALCVKTSYRDNPWFSATLEEERAYAERTLAPEDYANIWEGEPRVSSDAQVFKGRYEIKEFDEPSKKTRLFYGADWGFAADPTTLIRVWLQDDAAYIDQEAYAHGCELEGLAALFDTVPDCRQWVINADSARPEIIRSMRRQGFIIRPAKKWPKSVEEGVTVLRGLRRIYVHPRCVHMAEELRLYSYKQDSLTNEILPALVDKDNHCIDALRYALEPYIRGKVKGARK